MFSILLYICICCYRCYLIKTLINHSNGFNASKFVVFTPSLTDSTPGIGCYNTDMSITKKINKQQFFTGQFYFVIFQK